MAPEAATFKQKKTRAAALVFIVQPLECWLISSHTRSFRTSPRCSTSQSLKSNSDQLATENHYIYHAIPVPGARAKPHLSTTLTDHLLLLCHKRYELIQGNRSQNLPQLSAERLQKPASADPSEECVASVWDSVCDVVYFCRYRHPWRSLPIS
jgi:hypothetical protein